MVNNISDVTNKIIDLDTAIVNNVDAMNEVNNVKKSIIVHFLC